MQQADDFHAESEALFELLRELPESEFERATEFKGWTLNNVIRHLHVWNLAADLSLTDEAGFDALFAQVGESISGGLKEFEASYLKGLSGQTLLSTWRDGYQTVAGHFRAADPSQRVKWAGPSMSARSSITARLMETWAHGQEVYDELGVTRENADRIRNIVVLGNNTYGWTYAVRGEQAPTPTPHLVLTAPSGEVWTFNDPSEVERIEGLAEEFCQVVTQVRNIADTGLRVTGDVAADWMSKAQCFAGPPETPPAPGVRRTRTLPA
jgi:uncharacterized protein (TIGR03084 family)